MPNYPEPFAGLIPAAGKTDARRKALKSGVHACAEVIQYEHSEDLQALSDEYMDRYSPTTPEARALVDDLVSAEWLLRRLRKVEAHVWTSVFMECADHPKNPRTLYGEAFRAAQAPFLRLQRRIDACRRAYHQALKALTLLQAQPGQSENSIEINELGFVSSIPPVGPPVPGPEPPIPDNPPKINPIGFVPSNKPEPSGPPAVPPSAPASDPKLIRTPAKRPYGRRA